MNKLWMTLGLVVLMVGCTERVPPGYVGMVMTPSGLQSEVLSAGNHSVYGRDRIVLLETKEAINTEKLSILCADDLNFAFDLKIRAMLNLKDSKGIRKVLDRQGSNIAWDGSVGVLGYKSLYTTYVQPSARSIARGVVSRYKTTEIRSKRGVIQTEIAKQLAKALSGTPTILQMVAASNFDYPKVITEAVQRKRQRELQIAEEQASREIELEKARNKREIDLQAAKNRREIAEQLKAARVAEAEAEAGYNQVLARSLSSNYLRLRELENQAILYKNAKATQMIITDGKTPFMNMMGRK